MRYPSIPKNILITGCSSGIGLAAAKEMKARGWRVIPTARRESDLANLRAEGFDPLALEVSDAASVAAAAAEALRRFDGQSGAIVNNAGYGQPGALEDISRESMRQQFETNVIGLQDLTNRFIPVFRKAGCGRIVNVSSVVGRLSLPLMGIYSASKFAVEGMSDVLRIELRGSGVAVSIIEPGPIRTRFGENAAEAGLLEIKAARGTGAVSVFDENYRRRLEQKRIGDEKEMPFTRPPEAVAAVIAHAVTSRHPRRRYPVTVPAHLGAWMSRWMPAALLDAALSVRVRDLP